MVKFKLNHTCNMPGSKGVAGDIIQVSEDRAKFLLDRKGGEIVKDSPKAPAAEKSDSPEGDDDVNANPNPAPKKNGKGTKTNAKASEQETGE